MELVEAGLGLELRSDIKAPWYFSERCASMGNGLHMGTKKTPTQVGTCGDDGYFSCALLV